MDFDRDRKGRMRSELLAVGYDELRVTGRASCVCFLEK